VANLVGGDMNGEVTPTDCCVPKPEDDPVPNPEPPRKVGVDDWKGGDEIGLNRLGIVYVNLIDNWLMDTIELL
jgi:hypothetical protein